MVQEAALYGRFFCVLISRLSTIHMPQVASLDRHAGDVGFASQQRKRR